MTLHLKTKFFALALSLLIWGYVTARDIERIQIKDVPVSIKPPSGDISIVERGFDSITISISGPRGIVKELSGPDITASYTIGEDDAPENPDAKTRHRIQASDLKFLEMGRPLKPELRDGLVILSPKPEDFYVVLNKNTTRQIKVIANVVGELQKGYELAETPTVRPDIVTVTGPHVVLAEYEDTIKTAPLSIEDRNQSFTIKVPLQALVKGSKVQISPEEVSVTVAIREKFVTRTLPPIPVKFLVPQDFKYEYGIVEKEEIVIRVKGPAQDFEKGELIKSIRAIIDIERRKMQKPGVYPEAPEIIFPPELNFEAVEIPKLKFEIKENKPAPQKPAPANQPAP